MTNLADDQCNIFGTCRKSHRAAAVTPMAGSQQETNHRIANGVQFAAALLRHESRRITSVSDARDARTRTADRLNAIAHLHRQLSQAQPAHKVELTAFIRPFCKDISGSKGVIFDLEPNAVKLRANVAAQICIILNELATNAQKHGARDGGPVTMTLKVPPITEIESAVHVSIKEEFSTKYALSKKLFKLSSSERVGCGGCALP